MAQKLPKLGFLYLDYVLRFFDKSNFKDWPNKIEQVVYHWKNDKDRFIEEVKKKKIDILIGNIPATAYDTFVEISKELPNVRFVPSIESQFPNKSKENVTLFCEKYNLSAPKTWIFYDKEEGIKFLKEEAKYPLILKRSYGPSNYGGYYVHYIREAQEAIEIIEKKKYNPIYIQEALPLNGKDIRVMLIGHKPVCAFWRVAGEGMDITNTSQGGYIDYNNVPMHVLELAVKASKAAKAEYFACDIADIEGKPYILECATAFAAFPYIRDWIGQYLMWDFSNGRFKKPYFPLYNWEELGKIDSSLLRTMRHIEFSKYIPSTDGAFFINKKDAFDIELTQESRPEDIPYNPYKPLKLEEEIPDIVKEENKEKRVNIKDEKFSMENITLTKLMSLHGMEEELAKKIIELIEAGELESLDDLMEYDYIDEQLLNEWKKSFRV